MGHFCSPSSGSGFRIRIRIHWPDWILIRIRNPVYTTTGTNLPMWATPYRQNAELTQPCLSVNISFSSAALQLIHRGMFQTNKWRTWLLTGEYLWCPRGWRDWHKAQPSHNKICFNQQSDQKDSESLGGTKIMWQSGTAQTQPQIILYTRHQPFRVPQSPAAFQNMTESVMQNHGSGRTASYLWIRVRLAKSGIQILLM